MKAVNTSDGTGIRDSGHTKGVIEFTPPQKRVRMLHKSIDKHYQPPPEPEHAWQVLDMGPGLEDMAWPDGQPPETPDPLRTAPLETTPSPVQLPASLETAPSPVQLPAAAKPQRDTTVANLARFFSTTVRAIAPAAPEPAATPAAPIGVAPQAETATAPIIVAPQALNAAAPTVAAPETPAPPGQDDTDTVAGIVPHYQVLDPDTTDDEDDAVWRDRANVAYNALALNPAPEARIDLTDSLPLATTLVVVELVEASQQVEPEVMHDPRQVDPYDLTDVDDASDNEVSMYFSVIAEATAHTATAPIVVAPQAHTAAATSVDALTPPTATAAPPAQQATAAPQAQQPTAAQQATATPQAQQATAAPQAQQATAARAAAVAAPVAVKHEQAPTGLGDQAMDQQEHDASGPDEGHIY